MRAGKGECRAAFHIAVILISPPGVILGLVPRI